MKVMNIEDFMRPAMAQVAARVASVNRTVEQEQRAYRLNKERLINALEPAPCTARADAWNHWSGYYAARKIGVGYG